MPYLELSTLNQRLEVGKDCRFLIKCNGNPTEPGGYAINLQEKPDDSTTILFHFNPRGASSKVAINSCIKKKWKKEVTISGMNVKEIFYDNRYELKLHVKDKRQVGVYINDVLKTDYVCPEDITEARFVCFSEDLELASLKQTLVVGQDCTFTIKCNGDHSQPCGYAINLQETPDDTNNILFHFNPRAASSKVAINSRIKKKWKKEVALTGMNVQKIFYDEQYELKLQVRSGRQVGVYINGELKTDYLCPDDIINARYVCFSDNVTIISE